VLHGTTQNDGEHMRLTVTEAAKLYEISRTTIYRKINNGSLSADTDNKIDLSEMIRVFGEAKSSGTKSVLHENTSPVSVLQSDKELVLLEKIKGLEQEVKSLQSQLESAQSMIEWFKAQVEKPQKLIEHKTKKTLFGRVLSAITND
jgi:predicted DNA-binding transcriptional regulator AlpA